MLQRQVRTVQTVQQNVEIPLVQFFGKVPDVPVVVLRPVPVVQTVLLVFGGRRSCEHAATSSNSSRFQAAQKTFSTGAVFVCGRPCAHAATSGVPAVFSVEVPQTSSSTRCRRSEEWILPHFAATPAPLEPSTTNNCWPSRAQKIGTHVQPVMSRRFLAAFYFKGALNITEVLDLF